MKSRALLFGVLFVAGGMVLGRCSGLLREMALARVFGLTRGADLALFAMTLPDLLTNVLIGGAISTILIPEYHRRVETAGEEAARRLVGQTFLVMLGGSALLALGLCGLASPWVRLLAPGFEGVDHTLAVAMARVALLAFPLTGLTAVAVAVLQIHERLKTATLGTVAFNLGAVAIILGFAAADRVLVAAWGVVAGAALRFLMQLVAAIRSGGFQGAFRGWSRFDQVSPALASRYAQALGTTGLVVFLPAIARAFASDTPGEVAAVSYAIKLSELPAGVCTAILSMIMLPRISRAFQSGNAANGDRLLRRTAWILLGAIVPAVLVVRALASPIVHLIFCHGELDARSAQLVSELAQITLLGVPFALLAQLGTIGFHARRRVGTPLGLGLAVLGILVPMSWSFSARWGIHGVMASTAAANALYCLGLWTVLLRIPPAGTALGETGGTEGAAPDPKTSTRAA